MDTNFLGYRLNVRSRSETAGDVFSQIKAGTRRLMVNTINAHSTCVAQDDAAFDGALKDSDVLLADGTSVVLAGRALGLPVVERISGYDFFTAISELAEKDGDTSFFFLGSSEAVLAQISERLKQDYPSIRIAGTLSPPFKPEFSDEDNEVMIKAVNDVKPDVLWVGMTAPKQEKWMAAHKDRLDVGFSCAIGAVFDFYAGNKARAPEWMQKFGLEWLHRLCSEPRRVWKRYIINNPRFVWIVLKSRMSKS